MCSLVSLPVLVPPQLHQGKSSKETTTGGEPVSVLSNLSSPPIVLTDSTSWVHAFGGPSFRPWGEV